MSDDEIPTTPEDVAKAEAEIDESAIVLPPSIRDPYALLDHGLPDEVWQNADDSGPIPGWMTDVACWLTGGRFAVETRRGTAVAEPLDWICYKNGSAWVVPFVARL